ncbi:hypothetical protein PL11201_380005 [Planktothrix sp. PCC 11201]|nr:hypothetical protein PL11201_380005 [Planktothrix sp. PCC 11201]
MGILKRRAAELNKYNLDFLCFKTLQNIKINLTTITFIND